MSYLAGPRRTQPLSDIQSERVTRPLQNAQDRMADLSTAILPRQTRPLNTPVSSIKQPLVIPATIKRLHTDQLKRRRSPAVLLGAILGSIAVFILASLLVAPLDNGQSQQNLAQRVNNW